MKAAPIESILDSQEWLANNILATYDQATDQDRQEGTLWYPLAHLFAHTVGIGSVKRGAGILAALSPQTSWPENKRLALNARTGKITGHTGANCRKALECRQGFEPLDVLGGNKVRAFYSLILEPGNAFDVVVDRHAFDVALGYVTNNLARKVLERRGGYDYVADAYRNAAAELGILPSVLQATVWLTWRRQVRSNESSLTTF